MLIQTPKNRIFAAMLIGTALIGMTSTGQASGLNDLFNNSSTQGKFLSVDEAFDVSSSSRTTNSGTRVTISFDITPEHYVYKDKLTMSFPKGVSATPFTFSQSPVTVDDPTFGRVPVFNQTSVTATTTLTATKGKTLKNAPITIGWQGCAEAGLCYPPEKIKTRVDIAPKK